MSLLMILNILCSIAILVMLFRLRSYQRKTEEVMHGMSIPRGRKQCDDLYDVYEQEKHVIGKEETNVPDDDMQKIMQLVASMQGGTK